MTTKKMTVADQLGSEFWMQPDHAVMSESMQLVYASVAAMLREELDLRDSSVIDYMLAERIAAGYAVIREREMQARILGSILDSKEKKEINTEWTALAMQVKKLWSTDKDDKASELVLKKVGKALDATLKTLPADQRAKIQKEMAQGFEAVGL